MSFSRGVGFTLRPNNFCSDAKVGLSWTLREADAWSLNPGLGEELPHCMLAGQGVGRDVALRLSMNRS